MSLSHFSAGAFYSFGEIILNGSHESPSATSRHFHISMVWLCVNSVCSATLTGHCGQWVRGSTDSHCVKRMLPSLLNNLLLYWTCHNPIDASFEQGRSGRVATEVPTPNVSSKAQNLSDLKKKKNTSSYLNDIIGPFRKTPKNDLYNSFIYGKTARWRFNHVTVA